MMRLLLDTHALFWSLADERRLSPKAFKAIINPHNQVYFSPISVFELLHKASKGKLKIKVDLESAIEECRFLPLELSVAHAVAATDLPLFHGDPFDRLLVAQAKCEGLTLVTRNAQIPQYGVAVLEA